MHQGDIIINSDGQKAVIAKVVNLRTYAVQWLTGYNSTLWTIDYDEWVIGGWKLYHDVDFLVEWED